MSVEAAVPASEAIKSDEEAVASSISNGVEPTKKSEDGDVPTTAVVVAKKLLTTTTTTTEEKPSEEATTTTEKPTAPDTATVEGVDKENSSGTNGVHVHEEGAVKKDGEKVPPSLTTTTSTTTGGKEEPVVVKETPKVDKEETPKVDKEIPAKTNEKGNGEFIKADKGEKDEEDDDDDDDTNEVEMAEWERSSDSPGVDVDGDYQRKMMIKSCLSVKEAEAMEAKVDETGDSKTAEKRPGKEATAASTPPPVKKSKTEEEVKSA